MSLHHDQHDEVPKVEPAGLIARDLLSTPSGPVTRGTVIELQQGGFSGGIIEIAQDLAAPDKATIGEKNGQTADGQDRAATSSAQRRR